MTTFKNPFHNTYSLIKHKQPTKEFFFSFHNSSLFLIFFSIKRMNHLSGHIIQILLFFTKNKNSNSSNFFDKNV
jgi:hypothetical protein